MANPWHEVEIGKKAPEVVNGIVEIPKNSKAKYELHKESGMLMLDRVLYSAVHYPANYGFIPKTYCDDGDALDILILSQIEIVPFCIVSCKVIGVMQMADGGEMDDKIIAVAADDMSVSHINDLSELPEHQLNELRCFFEDYKKLEKKTVEVKEFKSKEVAYEIIQKSIEDYKEKFAQKEK